MKVMGVDQSFSSTGIVVIDGDFIEFAGTYVSNKNADIFSRTWEIATHIAETAKEHNATAIALEGIAFGARGNATRNLAGLQFVIYSVLNYMEGRRVDIIVPGTVKKFATGSGRATKEEMVEKLPVNVLGYFQAIGAKKSKGLYDLTDAYFIAKYYENNFNEIINRTK